MISKTTLRSVFFINYIKQIIFLIVMSQQLFIFIEMSLFKYLSSFFTIKINFIPQKKIADASSTNTIAVKFTSYGTFL